MEVVSNSGLLRDSSALFQKRESPREPREKEILNHYEPPRGGAKWPHNKPFGWWS